MKKIKQKMSNLWYSLKRWFHTRENYQKHFDSHHFFMNILYFIITLLLTLFIYKQINFFNQYNLLFIRIGSSLLLVGAYFVFKYVYYIGKQIKHKHYNLSRGQKTIIALIIIIFLLLIYENPDNATDNIKKATDKVELNNFNPFSVSEIVGKSNIISPDASSSKFDLRNFTNFLPQPWGFLIFWAILIGIILALLAKLVFRGELPSWIVWGLIIIGVIMAFQYKIPYDTVDVNDFNMKCNSDNKIIIENNMFGLGELTANMQLGMSCIEYKSSQCRPLCINNKPMCQCEANLIDLLFSQKGDWFFGG